MLLLRTSVLASAIVLILSLPVHANPFVAYPNPLPVGPFALKDPSGKTWTRDDLRGKVWVVQFFYCTCLEGCRQTAKNIEQLQTAFAGRTDVAFVSIHVFPQGETLDELREFAREYHADPEQWLFLTGQQDTVYDTVQKSFFASVAEHKEKKKGYQVGHRWWLFLIDPEGNIRGKLEDGRDPEEVKKLEGRIRALVPGSFLRALLPSVNAGLNALCTALLIMGFLAIRRRQEKFHTVCMASAVVVSAVFLASYLYYHFAVLEGQPTRFRGEGWVRTAYFAVLLSHTVLAAAAAPLVLITFYLGVRDRRAAHRRLARWTFPIWLYVSITGVVVYWMLYHLYPAL